MDCLKGELRIVKTDALAAAAQIPLAIFVADLAPMVYATAVKTAMPGETAVRTSVTCVVTVAIVSTTLKRYLQQRETPVPQSLA
mmetsp:Transcript_8438/g.12876  ORF Transcript_8438/g.12876 Transcript_8438/m.12876 type:complete len:84 (+) Transcript_8438:233-484(+)